MTSPVARRLVFHIGGYDPMPPDAAYRRFARELGRFRSTWSVEAEAGSYVLSEDEARWRVRAVGPDWVVESDVRLLRWDDVMARMAERPAFPRFGLGALTFLDFVAGGAFWGYARFAWRYALFFLYPFILFGLMAVAAALLGTAAGRGAGLPWLTGPVGLAALAGLVWFGWGPLRLDHMLDDWIFARDLIRAPDPALGARLGRAAEAVAAEAGSGRWDEVVVLGHSLGAVLAVDVVDRALALRPDLGRGGTRVSLVTVGSSIPKVGLHRAAVALRAGLGRVGAADGVFWVEYQALVDVMNFYGFDPVRDLRAGPAGPHLRKARISRMLSRPYYDQVRWNFFRVHNQFVSGNDQRAAYDYFMVVCGPWDLREQALAPEGAAAVLAPDGSLRRLQARDGETGRELA